MFAHIMVPVDLSHKDKLVKSLGCAAEMAQHWKAKITYVGVTSSAPGSLAHTPEEFRAKLDAFAQEQAAAHGISASGHAEFSKDPTSDLDKVLMRAVKDTGADLVIMESHAPSITDYVWPSHGGKLADHAEISVMLVRD